MHKERGEGEERVGDEMPRGLIAKKEANLRVKASQQLASETFQSFLPRYTLTNETLFAVYRPAR